MNKYNNPRLLNTVVSGTGMKNPVRPHVIIGSEKNGFIRGDLMDANAVKETVAEEVAERIDADLNLSEEIDTKVRQAVDDLVDGAPEVLDTLKELSEAIGDDENFITTVSGKIADIEDLLPEVYNINGHEYVDLGLPSGTLWATCNVGASSPEEYGNYYMYGMGNKTYDAADTPYDGTEDTFDLSVDTARQVMGGAWCMPTVAQMEELIDNTTCQWIEDYQGSGINGVLITATNGAVLFLPAAGYLYEGYQDDVMAAGYYWSSSSDRSTIAYILYFDNSEYSTNNQDRKAGYPVRGVINPEDVNKTFVPVASKDEVQINEKVVAAALNDLNQRKVDAEVGKTLSSNDFTDACKSKLNSIASGAEVNVQADWNVTSTSSDAYIKNKPTVVTQSQVTQQINQLSNTINSNIQDLTTALEDDEYVLAQAITTLNTKLREANIEIEDLKQEMDIDDLTHIDQYDEHKLMSLVQGTNNRHLLTTTYLGNKLIIGNVEFFTDNMAHQITAIATTNVDLDAWSLDHTRSHTDGEVNTYVAFYGWNNPPEYSGLEEGVWTDWKKLYMTHKDAQDMYSNITVTRNTMSNNTFDDIFEITDPDELNYIVTNWNPVVWITQGSNAPFGQKYPFMQAQFMSDGDIFTVITTRLASATHSFEMKYKTAAISGDTVTWDSDWTYIHGSAPILA